MSWTGFLGGLSTKQSSGNLGRDESGKQFSKSESLKGTGKSHDHSWSKTTREAGGGTRTEMGYVDRNSCTRDRNDSGKGEYG